MQTVQQILGKTELEIKRMPLAARIQFQDKLTDENNHTAVILVDAIVQSHQTAIDGLCFIYTLQRELGELPYELSHARGFIYGLLKRETQAAN